MDSAVQAVMLLFSGIVMSVISWNGAQACDACAPTRDDLWQIAGLVLLVFGVAKMAAAITVASESKKDGNDG